MNSSPRKDANKKKLKTPQKKARGADFDEYLKKSAERLRKFRENPPAGAPVWEEEYIVEEIPDDEQSDENEVEEILDDNQAAPYGAFPPPPYGAFPPPPYGAFPPPPFGAFPPPPPQFGAFTPAPQVAATPAQAQSNDATNEQSANERMLPAPQMPRPQVEKRRGMDLTNNETIARMQEEGAKLADQIDSTEKVRGFFASIVHFSLSMLVLCVFVAGCFFLVKYFYDDISQKGTEARNYNNSLVQNTNDEKSGWLLSASRANDLVKAFYTSMGDISEIGTFTDMSLRGFIKWQKQKGEKEEFYCIKKPDMCFLKIGMAANERAYLIDTSGGETKVYQLLDKNVAGTRKLLTGIEAEKIKSLVFSDDEIFSHAFYRDLQRRSVADSGINYAGRESFAMKNCDILQIVGKDGIAHNYYFDAEMPILRGISADINDVKFRYVFNRYISSDGGYKVPETREIFINDEPYATVYVDFVVRNRGVMFPQ